MFMMLLLGFCNGVGNIHATIGIVLKEKQRIPAPALSHIIIMLWFASSSKWERRHNYLLNGRLYCL